jgi:hypothetical protein
MVTEYYSDKFNNNYSLLLPTNSMEQSPTSEARTCQGIPRLLQNPKAHYRVRKCRQLVPIMNR